MQRGHLHRTYYQKESKTIKNAGHVKLNYKCFWHNGRANALTKNYKWISGERWRRCFRWIMSQTESKHSLLIFLPLAVNVEESSSDITVSVLVFRCLLKHMDIRAVFSTLFSEGLCFFYNFSLSPLTSRFFLSLVFLLCSHSWHI